MNKYLHPKSIIKLQFNSVEAVFSFIVVTRGKNDSLIMTVRYGFPRSIGLRILILVFQHRQFTTSSTLFKVSCIVTLIFAILTIAIISISLFIIRGEMYLICDFSFLDLCCFNIIMYFMVTTIFKWLHFCWWHSSIVGSAPIM